MEHIETKDSWDSQLQFESTCSIRIIPVVKDNEEKLHPSFDLRLTFDLSTELKFPNDRLLSPISVKLIGLR